MRRALITGITGQDGSYLAELLLKKGYNVWGIIRRSSTFNTSRIDHLIRQYSREQFDWVRADMTDQASLMEAARRAQPDEVYNLAAQSHVKVSFEMPIYTFDVCATGTLRLLEAIRAVCPTAKFYQASSSEMFGGAPPPQSEDTPFLPNSPYAVGKTSAYLTCANYRESFGMWIANGILFNHESPRRGETFVTRKVTRAVARILTGVDKQLVVGNVDSARDWGYAPEYVEMMWKMLQQRHPNDYVIATGRSCSVKEFINSAFGEIGITLAWRGSGNHRFAIAREVRDSNYGRPGVLVGDTLVKTSLDYYRPVDPENLQGDSKKAKKYLGWQPKTSLEELVKIMVSSDVNATRVLLEGTRKHKQEWREYLM